MKLHDLTVGQRFTFTDKHRGKVFEIMERGVNWIRYFDVANKYSPHVTHSTRKTFRMSVQLVTDNRVVELTPREEAIIATALMLAIKISSEDGEPESSRNEINKVYLKITGSAGRRVVRPNNDDK